MNKPGFTRAWRLRYATRCAAKERRYLKVSNNRKNRRKAAEALRNGVEPPVEKPLGGWVVI